MLVEVHVSSMKTRRCGSRSSCPSNQSSRRFRTSGRSCSLAWADFFERQSAPIEEGPQRRTAGPYAAFGQKPLQQFGDRQVRRFRDQSEQVFPMRIELRAARLTLLAGGAFAALARPANPTIAVASPTPKRAATWRADTPDNAASITRSRKSWL
jgi:hypothetical protein